MEGHSHKPRDKTIIGLLIFSIVSILGITVGYSALNTKLSISGDAYVRVAEDIRITELKMIEATNGAYEIYNNKYSKDTTNMFVSLPSTNSTITYEVTLVNNSSIKYQLKDIVEKSYTNKNISYEIVGLNIDDIIPKNTTIKFQVKFTTTTNHQETNVLLNYVFQEFTKQSIVGDYTDVSSNFNFLAKDSFATGFGYGWTEYFGYSISNVHVSMRNNEVAAFSNEALDVTSFDTLVFELELVTNNPDLSFISYIGIIDSSTPQDMDFNKFAQVERLSHKGITKANHTVNIDVSKLSGKYFIKIMSVHGGEVEAYTGFTGIKSIYLK